MPDKPLPDIVPARPVSRRSFVTGALGLAAGLAGGLSPLRPALAADAGYAEARLFHEENKNDLRLPALQARDRRGAVPNNGRPPSRRVPVHSLPPNPAARDGVIRRVQPAGGEKVCALTFDMCELATSTSGFDADLVIWLQDASIPATFFLGGKWMRSHERRVREMLCDPLFELASHAWAHGNFALLSRERMREEILDTQCQYELLLEEHLRTAGRSGLGGSLPVPECLRHFRFPYGRCSPEALDLLAELGLEPVQWDVVAETGGSNASIARARLVAEKVRPGSILLFHGNLVPKGTFQLLRYVVNSLERQGYRFATVGELLSLGEPQRDREGYFERPGDNVSLDTRFGREGTGR